MNKLNIVIIGVGGQGTLMASRVLGALAIAQGYDVKVSEVHGMSQRGGSVITYVRMAQEPVYASIVEQNGADYILAFEELEALRALPFIKENGTILVNTQRILPMPVLSGTAEYPKDILATLREQANVVAFDAVAVAQQAGTQRAVNTVLLGALASRLSFEKQAWLSALSAVIPSRFIDINIKAFEAGYQF